MAMNIAKFPVVQVALDFIDLPRALKLAKEASAGGVDWIEAGTPLIKSEGLNAVRELRREFPHHVIIADMKVMDAGRTEVETAAKAGADVVAVLGAASDATISQCVEAGKSYGCRILVDLINIADPAKRAKEAEALGADFIGVHLPIDDQMRGLSGIDRLRAVAGAVSVPIAVAGGVNSENAAAMVEAGAKIVIVGGSIHKAPDAKEAAANICKAVKEKAVIPTELFKRGGAGQIRQVLERASAANISDALHRGGVLAGIRCLTPKRKLVGQVLTVRTAPGDWAKPVEAIDQAGEGGVVVVDAGGVPPAIWGALATQSAISKKLAGVVIHGYARDIDEILDLGLPVYATGVTPNAGEPKGYGEIGAPIVIGGRKIETGDWVVADGDGVVTLPRGIAVEYANRAQDVFEAENRLGGEINQGSTLSQVAQLLRWEKK